MVLTVRSIVCWTRRRDPCPRWWRMAPPPAAALSRRRVALAARVKRPWVWRPSLAFRFFFGKGFSKFIFWGITKRQQMLWKRLDLMADLILECFAVPLAPLSLGMWWMIWMWPGKCGHVAAVTWGFTTSFFGGGLGRRNKQYDSSWLFSIIVNDLNFYFPKTFSNSRE